MNKLFLTLLGLILIIPAFADSYTLYVIEADQPLITERPDLDIPTVLNTPGIRVTHTLQTEGVPYSQKPAASPPSTDPFADSSEEKDGSADPGKDKVGIQFKVREDGDQIDYSFSEVKEMEVSEEIFRANQNQPIFGKLFLASELTLKPDTFVLSGGLHRQDSVDDHAPTHSYRWFVLVRGEPEKAKIQTIAETTTSHSNPLLPLTFEDLDSFGIEIEITPKDLILSGETVSVEELMQKLDSQAKDQKIILRVAPTIKMERVLSVLEPLKSEDFEQISIMSSNSVSSTINR